MALAVILMAAALGVSQAYFKCDRDLSQFGNTTNQILNLGKVLDLESLCFKYCEQKNCTSECDCETDAIGTIIGAVGNVAFDLFTGPIRCLLDPNNDGTNPSKITVGQSCSIQRILDLNLLDTCDIQAITTGLLKRCPNSDQKGACLTACACCDDGNVIDACVSACLSQKNGLKVKVDPLEIPILGIGENINGGVE